jgi:L-lactate permease
MWSQVYDPLHNIVLSALLAAVPVAVLLGALGVFHVKAHLAALLGLAASLLISLLEFDMPVQKSLMAAVFGAAYGFLPIGWIILNLRFSLLTIACMLALGFVTRYSGTDARLGLAFAQTGVLSRWTILVGILVTTQAHL